MSKCSSSSAAYSQTLSGLAEDSATKTLPLAGLPGQLPAECGMAAVVIEGVQPGGKGPAAFCVGPRSGRARR